MKSVEDLTKKLEKETGLRIEVASRYKEPMQNFLKDLQGKDNPPETWFDLKEGFFEAAKEQDHKSIAVPLFYLATIIKQISKKEDSGKKNEDGEK